MKNFIINIFKTLFFFDLAVIIIPLLPVIEKSDGALTKLISEALVLAVIVIFTIIFILVIEKKQITLPIGKHKFKSFWAGVAAGAVLPVVFIAITAVFKQFNYIGINKISHYYYWILALLCNAIATELMLRGYLFSLYKKFYGFSFAAVVTTLLYLSLNINIFTKNTVFIVNIILFNILLCFLLEYSKSIITTITAHFIYTLLSTFILGSYQLTGEYPTLLNYTFAEKKLIIGSTHPIEESIIILAATSVLSLIFIFKKYEPVKRLKELRIKLKFALKNSKFKKR